MRNHNKNYTKKNSVSIGGQAVLEGVMMRGECSMATAVRDSDGVIRLETKRVKSVKSRKLFFKLPIVRGIISFVGSLFGGVAVLMRSADVYGEGEPTKFEKWVSDKLKIDVMSVVGFFSLVIALGLSVLLFMALPQRVRFWLVGDMPNVWAKNLIEGGVKLAVFITYILFCSLIKDVRRTFMYHGAEHKTISCYEKGLPLTPENAKKCTRVHNRCGTTFIFFVMIVSILVFACFEALIGGGITNKFLRILCKLAFLPLIAGLSYELLKGLAKTKCFIFFPLKAPGLLLQRITTREPDEKMLEVAITAFNAVLLMDSDKTVPEQKFLFPKKRKDVVLDVKNKLNDYGISENAESEWIVSLSLGVKRSELNSDALVSVSDIQKINGIVDKRITGKPLWYCIGNVDFMGITLNVDERVLIPRPETELLVENALQVIDKDKSVLDLCTGSGAIAIAVAKKSNAKVVAVDVSQGALDLAKQNCENSNTNVEFVLSNMFDNIGDRKFDVIISNPPYVRTEEIASLQKEVKDFEPIIALDGGKDGLDFYRIIAENCEKYLNKKGVLFLEVGENQAQDVAKLLSRFSSVEIIKDYENIDRIIKAVI